MNQKTHVSGPFPLSSLRARRTYARAARFLSETSGAVTVDWVVLTAAIVGLAIAVLVTISGGTTALASNTGDAIAAMDVGGFSDSAPQAPYENAHLMCSNTTTCTKVSLGGGAWEEVPNPTGETGDQFYVNGQVSDGDTWFAAYDASL
ncbi:MAG: hypothetical protein KDK10_10485 [Maritimibacter sp.]|nr:hypothetical protein [Maritimibacter sp.]